MCHKLKIYEILTVCRFQVYTSHGPSVVMPTWFCSREWYQKVGPFDEGGKVSIPITQTDSLRCSQTHFVALVDSPNVRNNSDRSPLYTWPVTSWMYELVVNVRKNYPDGKVWKRRSFQTLFEQLIRTSFKAFDFSPLLISAVFTHEN